MHKDGTGKGSANQRPKLGFCYSAPNIHRLSTAFCTCAVDNTGTARRYTRLTVDGAQVCSVSVGTITPPVGGVGRAPTLESDRFRLFGYRVRRSLGIIDVSDARGRARRAGW
jgi:hypothetical protein